MIIQCIDNATCAKDILNINKWNEYRGTSYLILISNLYVCNIAVLMFLCYKALKTSACHTIQTIFVEQMIQKNQIQVDVAVKVPLYNKYFL